MTVFIEQFPSNGIFQDILCVFVSSMQNPILPNGPIIFEQKLKCIFTHSKTPLHNFDSAEHTKKKRGKVILMTTPYRCPNCRTNRTRFNIIQQVPQSVKLDPQSGQVVQQYEEGSLEPFHLAYNGPELKVQCAACGLVEDEMTFKKFGENTH
jgi:hypothetical protein